MAAEGPSCSLSLLNVSLHLISFFASSETLLARHFVRHYRGVGVPLRNMLLLIHRRANDSLAYHSTLEALREEGLDEGSVSHPLVDAARDFEKVKVRNINARIMRLPEDAYVIYADVDEFFSFPCDMVRRLAKHDIFCATMSDRMAANGKVMPLRRHPDIAAQFPHRCYVRQHVRRKGTPMNTVKVALMRVRRRSDKLLRLFTGTPLSANTQQTRMQMCGAVAGDLPGTS